MIPAPATTPPRLTTLILLTAFSTLSLNMFLPSLASIAVDFRADYALVNLSIAGYLAVTAILQLIIGPLSDRYGRRPVMLGAIVIFVMASLGCVLARDIWTFLAFRMVQGVIIAGAALSPAMIRDTRSEREAASLLGYVTMAMAVAPMLAPMLGGALDQLFGWRSSFVFFVASGIAVFGLAWTDMGETNRSPSETFTKQFRDYPALFGSRRFWGYALSMSFSVGAFYCFLSGAPLVAQSALAIEPVMLGFLLGTITAGFAFGSFLSGRYSARFGLTAMMLVGRVVACGGLLLGLALYWAGSVNLLSFFGTTIFVGLGNGLTVPSSNVGAMSVRPHLAGSAAGLAGAMTVGSGALLTSFTGWALTPQNAVWALLAIMLASSAAAGIPALSVLWIDRAEGKLSR